MMEDFERIMSIAKEGRFDEARKVVQELDISETDKVRYNMMLWQLENKRHCPPPQPDIPKAPVISMILGIILICAAFFFNGSTQTATMLTGLVMAGVIPAIYCLREKARNDKLFDKRGAMSSMYSAEGADMNFPWRIPSASVIITMVTGIAILTAALYCYGNANDSLPGVIALILAAAGSALIAASRVLARSFNGTFMWAAISLSALFLGLGTGSILMFPESVITAAVFIVIAGLILLLYPLEYRLICNAFCSEQVDAECIDLQSTFGRRNSDPRYRAIWKYEYDGVTYIHRDITAYKCPEPGEIRSIGISPGTPHNIFTGKAPVSALLFSASGFFILAFLLLYLMPPA